MLDYIVWNVNPELITWPVTIRWYGLMFAIGFWLGFNVVARMFKREGAPERWMGSLLIYVAVATVVGARLGHVFFYQWDYYSQHPPENPRHLGGRTRKPRRSHRHHHSHNILQHLRD